MTHAYRTRNHRVNINIIDAGIIIIQSSISTNRFISVYTPTDRVGFTSGDKMAEVVAPDFLLLVSLSLKVAVQIHGLQLTCV